MFFIYFRAVGDLFISLWNEEGNSLFYITEELKLNVAEAEISALGQMKTKSFGKFLLSSVFECRN